MKAEILALARRGVPLVGAGALLGLGVTLAAQRRAAVEPEPEPECSCFPTPEEMHFVYYGATEPGSAMEWNPECEVHRRDEH